jgi:short-subunit dehydrogenase
MSGLEERSVIVVGATGGLGRPVAERLAASGAQLTLVGRDRTRLEATGISGRLVDVDIRKAHAPDRIVGEALDAYGHIDGVVFAAGAVAFGGIAETSDEVLIDLFTLNTLAPIRMLRAALPALQRSAEERREPFVLNISAVVAEQPQAGMAAYSAAKAALAAYDAAAMRELRRAGIRLVDARPPHTETGLADRPLSGTSPSLPTGLAPDAVAQRIVDGIMAGDKDLPSSAFM